MAAAAFLDRPAAEFNLGIGCSVRAGINPAAKAAVGGYIAIGYLGIGQVGFPQVVDAASGVFRIAARDEAVDHGQAAGVVNPAAEPEPAVG